MQNAAFLASGIQAHYSAFPVAPQPPTRVGEAIFGLRALGFRGVNVTFPHKETVVDCVGKLSGAAADIGAANTILFHDDGLIEGFNTDVDGFVLDLRAQGIEPLLPAVLLGAGGAASAVAYALLSAGCVKLCIANRSENRGTQLADKMKRLFPSKKIDVISLDDLGRVKDYSLVVNCIPNEKENSAWLQKLHLDKPQVAYDLSYSPNKTAFQQHVENFGVRTISGLGMLVHQGALSFEIWTGQKAPLAVMQQAVGL